MKNLFKVILLMLLVSACTHKIMVPLLPDYQKDVNTSQDLATIKPSIQFVRGEFSDKRSDISKLASFKQQIHTFELFAERPIENAIYDGLSIMLTKTGHKWTESGTGQIKLNLQLLSVTASRNAGMVMVGASSSIQIKLDFIDNNTGSLIYSQIYNGSDNREQAMVGLMDMVLKSIEASIINCINTVSNDKMFFQAIKSIK